MRDRAPPDSGSVCNLFICQTEQRIAASAHLDGDLAQRGPLESQARRLAVDRAAQVANLARSAFPETRYLLQRTTLRGAWIHKIILTRICFTPGSAGSATLELCNGLCRAIEILG